MKDKNFQENIKKIISEIVDINNVQDIYDAFNKDKNNKFKTIMRWNI